MGVTVAIDDSGGAYSATELAQIEANCVAAFEMWAPYLGSSAGTLDILITITTDTLRADGRSAVATYERSEDGFSIYTQGAAYELNTGNDPNGSAADIFIRLNPDFQRDYYWIDPQDGSTLPDYRSSLVDVLAHEIGHGLGFNGWTDNSAYTLPGAYESTFDSLIVVIDGVPYFTGANAQGVYGGPVPLTAGNVTHVGNDAPTAGSDLISDIMNGVVFDFHRYAISDLDVAILSDCGIATVLDDLVRGGTQNDIIGGGAGHDTLRGFDGQDTLDGGLGSDSLDGAAGDDRLLGGARWDTLLGGAGNDTLDGGLDNDQMYGGAGDDLYYVDNSGDRTNENVNEGTDSVIASISLSLAANIENLTLTGTASTGTGNSLNNRITGNDGANTLGGGNGNDTLDGGLGADSLEGGAGHDSLLGGMRWDTLIGGDGNDTLDGGADNDVMYGGLGDDVYHVDHIGDRVNESTTVNEGNDTVYASVNWNMTAAIEAVVLTGIAATSSIGNSLNNTMTGMGGNNTLVGGAGNDTINGGDGNDSLDGGIDSDLIDGGNGNDTLLGGQRWDTLTGGAGDDVIDGGSENDRMTGGAGNDTYYIDHVGDRVYELAGEGTDTVYSSIDWAMAPEIEHLFLIGTAVTGTGNGLNNRITGNASANVINGGNGADTIMGGAGNDTLTGGTARDDFVFSAAASNGTDRITDLVHAVDRLVFKGSDYGFSAGYKLTAAQFTAGSTAVGTGAQFIWDAATGHLYWDADGTGAGARVDLALFDGVPGLTKEDLVFT